MDKRVVEYCVVCSRDNKSIAIHPLHCHLLSVEFYGGVGLGGWHLWTGWKGNSNHENQSEHRALQWERY